MTLEEVAQKCVPPTTAQTIGRLETGTRTVSVDWLNRIAAALEVAPADLVTLPDRTALPVAATLDSDGTHVPRREMTLPAPQPSAGGIAILVTGSVGDYRAGDEVWCDLRAPDGFAQALNRDILLPEPAGRFLFARLIGIDGEALLVLPPTPAARPVSIPSPPWIAQAVRLIRSL